MQNNGDIFKSVTNELKFGPKVFINKIHFSAKKTSTFLIEPFADNKIVKIRERTEF